MYHFLFFSNLLTNCWLRRIDIFHSCVSFIAWWIRLGTWVTIWSGIKRFFLLLRYDADLAVVKTNTWESRYSWVGLFVNDVHVCLFAWNIDCQPPAAIALCFPEIDSLWNCILTNLCRFETLALWSPMPSILCFILLFQFFSLLVKFNWSLKFEFLLAFLFFNFYFLSFPGDVVPNHSAD